MILKRIAYLLCFSVLAGCASAPLPWTGRIEHDVPVDYDSSEVKVEDWVWIDNDRKWRYREDETLSSDDTAWDFEKDAIVLRLIAPKQLHSYKGKPHTLFLRVFQLSDIKVFNELRDTSSGMVELLTKKAEDLDDSFISVHKKVVAPEDNVEFAIDRGKKVQFLAIVAGYNEMKPEDNIRVFPVPVIPPRSVSGWAGIAWGSIWSSINPFAAKPTPVPARVKMWVKLGVTGLAKLQMITK